MKKTFKETALDKEVVDFFRKHINNPCGTEAGNLRNFYVREATKQLRSFTDPSARHDLEKLINSNKK